MMMYTFINTIFLQGEEIEKLLLRIAAGVELVQRRSPCLAIIHTVTGDSVAPLRKPFAVGVRI